MAAVGMARRRGMPLDVAAAAAQIELVGYFHGDEELNQEALFHPEPAIGHGYALLGLNAEDQKPGIVSDIMTHHLAVIQCEDGHWPLNILRPPIQSSKVAATALSVFALSRYGWPARADGFKTSVDKARRWLWKADPAFHEERVFQILGLAWSGESPRRLRNLTRALIEEQRENGGWGQLPGLAADAYATGQALYALQEAAGSDPEGPAIRRGREFLLSTQERDGTWHVRRRAFPFQPTIESGFPHGRDAWISAMATSWALMALAPAVDSDGLSHQATSPRQTEGIIVVATAGETLPVIAADNRSASADFVRDIQPLFQRSCLACHSGEKAKSNYRLETREDLLAAGNQGEAAVLSGKGAESPLIQYIAGTVPDMEMPPLGKRDKHPGFSAEEVSRVRQWIDAGAVWPDDVRLSASP
jgi:hypothetical protein